MPWAPRGVSDGNTWPSAATVALATSSVDQCSGHCKERSERGRAFGAVGNPSACDWMLINATCQGKGKGGAPNGRRHRHCKAGTTLPTVSMGADEPTFWPGCRQGRWCQRANVLQTSAVFWILVPCDGTIPFYLLSHAYLLTITICTPRKRNWAMRG